jgi:hypothetical protein
MPSLYKSPESTQLSLADVLSDLEQIKAAAKPAAEEPGLDMQRIEAYLLREEHSVETTLQATYAQSHLVTRLLKAAEGMDTTGERIQALQKKIDQVHRTAEAALR